MPEQYSHDTERALCAVLGNAGASRCEVLSFTRLWARVADVAGGGAVPTLDAGGRVLMLYRAMRQVEQMLKSYKAASRKPAFLTGLLASLDECRSYAVTPEALAGAGEALGGPQGEKLRDIGLIYAAYETLAAQGRADPAAVWTGWPRPSGIPAGPRERRSGCGVLLTLPPRRGRCWGSSWPKPR